MKIGQPYKCDYCGQQKQESNHWFVYRGKSPLGFTLSPWSEQVANITGAEHICSETCAHKALAKFMEEQHEVSHGSSQAEAAGQTETRSEVRFKEAVFAARIVKGST